MTAKKKSKGTKEIDLRIYFTPVVLNRKLFPGFLKSFKVKMLLNQKRVNRTRFIIRRKFPLALMT